MTDMKKLDFKKFDPGLTEEDMQKAEQESTAGAGKVFQPGIYDLKVLEFKHNITERNPEGAAKNDPSWLVFKLVLGGLDNRTISSYPLIPTRDLLFNAANSKNPKLMGIKFREFLRSLGVDPNTNTIGEVIEDLVSKPQRIVGAGVKVKIGYSKPYVKYDPTTRLYSIMDKNGEPLLADRSYTDLDGARADAAITLNLTIDKSFPEVLRYLEAAEKQAKHTGAQDWD